jgi:hypothetical protein
MPLRNPAITMSLFLLVCSVGAAAATGAFLLGAGLPSHGEPIGDVLEVLELCFIFAFVFTLLGLTCFGLPASLLLRRLRIESLGTYLFFGAVGGLLGAGILAVPAVPVSSAAIADGVTTAFASWLAFRRPSQRALEEA